MTISEGSQNDFLFANLVENFSPSVLTDKIFFDFEFFFKNRFLGGLKLMMKLKGFEIESTHFDLIFFVSYMYTGCIFGFEALCRLTE